MAGNRVNFGPAPRGFTECRGVVLRSKGGRVVSGGGCLWCVRHGVLFVSGMVRIVCPTVNGLRNSNILYWCTVSRFRHAKMYLVFDQQPVSLLLIADAVIAVCVGHFFSPVPKR